MDTKAEPTTARAIRLTGAGTARPSLSLEQLRARLGRDGVDPVAGNRPAAVPLGPAPGSEEFERLVGAPVAALAQGTPLPPALLETFPWSAVGRVAVGYREPSGKRRTTAHGTGVLVGRNVVLTAGHVLPWKYLASGNWWVEFFPGYDRGAGPAGSAMAEGWWGIEDKTPDDDDVGDIAGRDYAVIDLERPLGDVRGWIGTASLEDERYRELVYTSVGYPEDVGGGEVACVEYGLVIEDIDDASDGGKELETRRYPATGGWSGGPLWANVNGGTTVLGVASSPQKDFLQPTKVMHSGGRLMVDIVRHGLQHFGGAWSEIEENMTASFGYSQPKDGVAVCSWGEGRLDLFWRGPDDHLKHAWYPYDGGWSWEQDLTADFKLSPMKGRPAACSWSEGRLDVFWRGTDDHLKHVWYPYGEDWSFEQDLTQQFALTPLASDPAACSWGEGRLDVFWRATGDHLKHVWYPFGEDWSWEQDLTAAFGYGPINSSPEACSWGPERMDVFYESGGSLKHVWYPHGEDWSFEQDMTAAFGHGPIRSGGAAAGWEPGRVDLFWETTGRHLGHAWFPWGDDWSGTEDLTNLRAGTYNRIFGPPAVCSWGPGRLDVFYVASDGTMRHIWH
jgi:hypothetical protein